MKQSIENKKLLLKLYSTGGVLPEGITLDDILLELDEVDSYRELDEGSDPIPEYDGHQDWELL